MQLPMIHETYYVRILLLCFCFMPFLSISISNLKMKLYPLICFFFPNFPFGCKSRTKEQLGYVVECSPRITYRIHGFCFSVQSSKYNPVYLQSRIDSFINGLEELLVSTGIDLCIQQVFLAFI